MRRGFTFSIDALLAVVIAMLGVAAVVALNSNTKTTALEMAPLQMTAQDALSVLDKNGTLKNGFDQTDAQLSASLSASLARVVPQRMGARMNVTLCTVSGGASPVFTCSRNIVVQTNSSEMTVKSAARRVFSEMSGGRIGMAVLEVGYE